MRVTAITTRVDVERELARARDLRTGSGPWTCRFLAHADAQFGGRWTAVEITGTEALDIVLPGHAGEPCRGDRLTLAPMSGQPVHAVAAALAAARDAYAVGNPSCWSRIIEAMQAPLSTVILTTAPLTLPEYAGIARDTGRLYHLDGFHRLVAWALDARLSAEGCVRAFVAGTVELPH